GLDGVRRYGHSFYELVGVALHQHAVLEGAWFHLVGVRNEIFRPGSICPHWNEAPFHSRRKAGSPAALEIRSLHQLRYILRLQLQSLAKSLIATCLVVSGDIDCVPVVRTIAGERPCHHRVTYSSPGFGRSDARLDWYVGPRQSSWRVRDRRLPDKQWATG